MYLCTLEKERSKFRGHRTHTPNSCPFFLPSSSSFIFLSFFSPQSDLLSLFSPSFLLCEAGIQLGWGKQENGQQIEVERWRTELIKLIKGCISVWLHFGISVQKFWHLIFLCFSLKMLQRNFGISYLFSLSPPAKNLHQKKEKKNPCVYMAGVYLEKPVNPFLSLKTSFSCRKESLFVLQTLAKNYLWGMFTKVSSGLIFSPSFGWKCSHQCSYLPVLEPAVLHWGTAEQLEAGVTMAVSVRQFHRCHL